ncbi:MAG: type VI secretion system Vgr family protein [Janthinobacterium lividum]
MSYPIKVTVQMKGGPELADFSSLTLSQFMFTHHVFALDFSFEALGKALGLKPDTVHLRAHEQLSGKALTISWTGNVPGGPSDTFKFSGVITETSIHTASDLTNYYHISGHSPTYLLEDGVQNRSFIKQSVQDIVGKVLTPYSSNAFQRTLQARRADKLPYVVQYQESNYQFINRLAARQGEWLYYDGLTLRLGLRQGAATRFQSDSNQTFALTTRLQPGKTEGAHYSYRTHEPLHATASNPAGGHAFSQFALAQSDALFTQSHRLQGDTRLDDQTQLKQALDMSAAKRAGTLVTLEGKGEAFGLIPGALLDVFDAAGSGYGQFRTLSVRHEVDGAGNYTNHFEALPAALDSPPPAALGMPTALSELAEVIDLEDSRRLGRVRVRFQWSVARPADAESNWLRVSTPYSGDGKGQLFTPEKGSQVLVGYENGLPEFPVVLGNLFHPKNPQQAKYTNPSNHLKGLQTAGGNKFVLDDTKDKQTILLSNSNNKGTAIEVAFQGDGSISIKSNGPISLTAGGNITLTATKDIILTAENVTINARQKLAKTAKVVEMTGTESVDITGKTTALNAGETMTIAATSSLDVTGGHTASISSGKTRIH